MQSPRSGPVVSEDGYLKYRDRVHLGKHTESPRRRKVARRSPERDRAIHRDDDQIDDFGSKILYGATRDNRDPVLGTG